MYSQNCHKQQQQKHIRKQSHEHSTQDYTKKSEMQLKCNNNYSLIIDFIVPVLFQKGGGGDGEREGEK